jgi:hypothetical protein
MQNVFPISPAMIVKDGHTFCTTSDGLLVVSSSTFEDASISAGRQWLEGLGKQLFVVGPLEDVPLAATAKAPITEAPKHAGEDAKILGFLGDMEQKHGPRSVIFVRPHCRLPTGAILITGQIAFGTIFYPKDATKLHAFIDELIASETPFLWSHASPMAKVPEELANKINTSGHGYHTNWVPQRAVLRHTATGWFVSHGGWNSAQEAISHRVPMFAAQISPIFRVSADVQIG